MHNLTAVDLKNGKMQFSQRKGVKGVHKSATAVYGLNFVLCKKYGLGGASSLMLIESSYIALWRFIFRNKICLSNSTLLL